MEKKYYFLFLLLALAVIFINMYFCNASNEGFIASTTMPEYLSPSTCTCDNCVICRTEYGDECVAGNENGPYFREDCLDYIYPAKYRYSWLSYINPYYWWRGDYWGGDYWRGGYGGRYKNYRLKDRYYKYPHRKHSNIVAHNSWGADKPAQDFIHKRGSIDRGVINKSNIRRGSIDRSSIDRSSTNRGDMNRWGAGKSSASFAGKSSGSSSGSFAGKSSGGSISRGGGHKSRN